MVLLVSAFPDCRSAAFLEYTVNDFHSPSLLIAVQGAKHITVGQEVYTVDQLEMLMFPVALPVTMQTTTAKPSDPFLGIKLDLKGCFLFVEYQIACERSD